MKGSRSDSDADEDRDEGADKGGEDAEGPWGATSDSFFPEETGLGLCVV